MLDLMVVEQVAAKERTFTDAERQQAYADHDWLFEYVHTQCKIERANLSDAELASEISDAMYDYSR